MTRALVVLLACLSLPLSAQVVPDEMPDQTPMSDRVQRDLIERHRSFLSGLYSEGTLAAGPVVGSPAVYGSATVEGGYRFDSGDAVAVVTSIRSPLELGTASRDGVDELTAALGAQASVALRRFSTSPLARRAEVGLGLGVSFFGETVVTAVELTPRYAIPLTPTLSAPVGLRLSHELGGLDGRGPYVGLSIGLRRIWADHARMVLE